MSIPGGIELPAFALGRAPRHYRTGLLVQFFILGDHGALLRAIDRFLIHGLGHAGGTTYVEQTQYFYVPHLLCLMHFNEITQFHRMRRLHPRFAGLLLRIARRWPGTLKWLTQKVVAGEAVTPPSAM